MSKGVEGLLISAGIPLAAALVTLASERVRGIVEATFRHPTRRSLIVRSRLLRRRRIRPTRSIVGLIGGKAV